MSKNFITLTAHFSCLLCLIIASNSAYGKQDTLRPFVVAKVTYDDNVYLLSDQESTVDTIDEQSRSDLISHLAVGLQSDVTSRKQRYRFMASGFRREYYRFDRLDFTGGDLNAKWDWFYNKKWDGLISYSFSRDQSSLADQRLAEGDSYDLNRISWLATRHLTKNKDLYLLTSFSKKDYRERKELNNERPQLAIGYKLSTAKKNSVTLELSASEGGYDNLLNPSLGNPSSYNYDENVATLKFKLRTSSKTHISADIGYLSRSDNNSLADGDYDGAVYDLRYVWSSGSKTKIQASYRRQLLDTENTQTLHRLEDRGSIKARWDATNRMRLTAELTYRDLDYTQITGVRDDQVISFAIGSRYKLYPSVDLEVMLEKRSRDSSNFQNEYDNNIATISILYRP